MAKREEKERVSRREQRRLEAAKNRRNKNLLVGVPLGVIAIAIVGYIIFLAVRPDIEGVVTFGSQDRTHDIQVIFPESALPPVGGAHHPTWLNCGIYLEEVPVSNAVHSLEHGAVWVAYDPTLPAADIADLRDMVRGDGFVLLSPYPGLQSPVVATAWTAQLELDGVADARLPDFIGRFKGKGPEAGATCSGGVGDPQ